MASFFGTAPGLFTFAPVLPAALVQQPAAAPVQPPATALVQQSATAPVRPPPPPVDPTIHSYHWHVHHYSNKPIRSPNFLHEKNMFSITLYPGSKAKSVHVCLTWHPKKQSDLRVVYNISFLNVTNNSNAYWCKGNFTLTRVKPDVITDVFYYGELMQYGAINPVNNSMIIKVKISTNPKTNINHRSSSLTKINRCLPKRTLTLGQQLYHSDIGCDFTITVGSRVDAGRTFKCHKLILQLKSGYFSRVLSPTIGPVFKESNVNSVDANQMDLPDTSPEIIEMFLRLLYCDELKENIKQNDLFDLLVVADKFAVDLISQILISDANVLTILDASILLQNVTVQENAISYFMLNYSRVNYEAYMKVSLDCIIVILTEFMAKYFNRELSAIDITIDSVANDIIQWICQLDSRVDDIDKLVQHPHVGSFFRFVKPICLEDKYEDVAKAKQIMAKLFFHCQLV